MLGISINALAQQAPKEADFIAQVKAYQAKLNKSYADEKTSPLLPEDLKKFKTLAFYPANANLKIKAKFTKTKNAKPFEMATSTDRKPLYKEFGIATFSIDGKPYVLHIYQNLDLLKKPEFEDYLFVPFYDETNGIETYGGGRYIDTDMPEGDSIIIDFNKAYNPYCAYSYKFSCPIPPKENDLAIAIKAGVKAFKND